MADTLRYLAIAELKTALEAISISNGYATDIEKTSGGPNVKIWLSGPSTHGEGQAGITIVTPRAANENFASHDWGSRDRMTVNVLCWIRRDPVDSDVEAYRKIDAFLGDAERASTVDVTRGGNASETVPTDWEIGESDDGFVEAILRLSITIDHRFGDPTVGGSP